MSAVDTIAKLIVVDESKEILTRIRKTFYKKPFTQAERDRLAKAITSLNIAILETRAFIEDKGYSPNLDLTKLWQQSFNDFIAANIKDVPEFLYHKAQFWGKPQDWLKNEDTLKLVPKLRFLQDECDMLMKILVG